MDALDSGLIATVTILLPPPPPLKMIIIIVIVIIIIFKSLRDPVYVPRGKKNNNNRTTNGNYLLSMALPLPKILTGWVILHGVTVVDNCTVGIYTCSHRSECCRPQLRCNTVRPTVTTLLWNLYFQLRREKPNSRSKIFVEDISSMEENIVGPVLPLLQFASWK